MSKNNEFELQKPLHKRKDAVLFDLDGTLAETMTFAKHHKDRHEPFAREALEVDARPKLVDKLKKLREDGDAVVILTARSEDYRSETKKWLHENHIPYDALVMRPKSDTTEPDKKVKKELLEEDILPKFDIKKAYDDKKKNVKMFEKLGIDAKHVKKK